MPQLQHLHATATMTVLGTGTAANEGSLAT